MTFNVFSGVSAIQAAVTARVAGWTDTMASSVLTRVQDLPHWETAGLKRPESLGELAHPRTAVCLLLNPTFANRVLKIIGTDSRSVIGRETRPNRLLPDLSEPALSLTLTDHLHSVPSAKLVQLLQKHPAAKLFISRENRPETRVPPSIITLLMMAVKQGEKVTFRVEGEGGMEVLRQIQKFNAVEWFNGDRKRDLVAIREIRGTGLSGVVSQLLQAMQDLDQTELAAIYHHGSRRLVVGHILSTHKEIAKAAGFEDPASYSRMNLDSRGEFLQACFAPGQDEMGKSGRAYLQTWLADLFRGVDLTSRPS